MSTNTLNLYRTACEAQMALNRAVDALAADLGISTMNGLENVYDEIMWRAALPILPDSVASLRKALYLPPEPK